MKKLTSIKKKIQSFKKQIIASLIFMFLFTACYEFDFVIQPHSANINETFVVQISATTNNGSPNGNNYMAYFGIQLPESFIVTDSIQFESGTNSGFFIFSDSLTNWMDLNKPPPEGYKWWVSRSTDSVLYLPDDNYLLNPIITTGNDPGNYFLDYFISDSDGGMGYESHTQWSYNHNITVGLPNYFEVTNSNDNGPGSLRAAIDNVDFYGTIAFDLEANDTIILINKINVYKDIKILGDSINPVIISGNNTTNVISIGNNRSPVISNLIILKGKHYSGSSESGKGGGISCASNATPLLKNLIIHSNKAKYGSGIWFGSNCEPVLENVSITNNVAQVSGGGILFETNSNPIFDSINRCNIYSNSAISGNDLYCNYSENIIDIIVDTFSVLYPTDYHADIISQFTFDINYGKYEQVDADLYISPEGDNINNGLTPEEPLKTLRHAFMMMRADSLHINTIHLLEGTYSFETTGESFPVYLPDCINLSGENKETVILDADSAFGTIRIDYNSFNAISGINVRGAYYLGGISCVSSNTTISDVKISYNWGPGISCINSSPKISNSLIISNHGNGIKLENSDATVRQVEIRYNYAQHGGGIYCKNSDPILENLVIYNNYGGWLGGGGIYLDHSSPVIENTLISWNSASGEGGGIYCGFFSNPYIKNASIIHNSGGNGGGIYCSYNSNPILTNTILWDNQSEECYFKKDGGPNSITISWSDIQKGEVGIQTNGNGTVNWLEGNINEDPLFTGTGDYPYSLSNESPCVNTGTPDTTGLNLPELDLAGNPRVYGGRIEMGAYENQEVIVGITEPEDQKLRTDFTISPNPAKTKVFISVNNNEIITGINIYNQTGQKVINQRGITNTIDVSMLPQGMYIVEIESVNGIIRKKIIVE
jgi:hypothetical protein